VQIIEQIGKYSFSPATLMITKGTTIEWTKEKRGTWG
jgi:plastocyanin